MSPPCLTARQTFLAIAVPVTVLYGAGVRRLCQPDGCPAPSPKHVQTASVPGTQGRIDSLHQQRR